MIIRTKKNNNYTVINNTILNDDRLSWAARGLAAYLLTKPDSWEINRDHLAEQGPDGVWAVRSALKELRAAGYLSQRRSTNDEGKFCWEVVLHEVPVENQPSPSRVKVENQPSPTNKNDDYALVMVEKQMVENRTQVSTVEVSTKSSSLAPAPAPVTATADDDDDSTLSRPAIFTAGNGDATSMIAEALRGAGVAYGQILFEKYLDLAEQHGAPAVVKGIEAAVLNGKAHSFNYVVACAKTAAQGNGAGYKAAPVKLDFQADW